MTITETYCKWQLDPREGFLECCTKSFPDGRPKTLPLMAQSATESSDANMRSRSTAELSECRPAERREDPAGIDMIMTPVSPRAPLRTHDLALPYTAVAAIECCSSGPSIANPRILSFAHFSLEPKSGAGSNTFSGTCWVDWVP